MSYSLRERGGDRPDKRQRFDNSSNYGPGSSNLNDGSPVPQSIINASSVLFVGGFPPDWNEAIVESVVAGSGRIVDLRPRLDPSGRKNFCFVEYDSPEEASKAMHLLNEVTLGPKRKLRIELSKEGLRTSRGAERKILTLDRKFLPAYVNLPTEMRNNTQFVINANSNQAMEIAKSSTPVSVVVPVSLDIPEVLTSASKYLPQFNPETFKSEDKVSENLQNIPPAQLIELLGTLKNLINKNDFTSAQRVFNMAPSIPIAVSQALILMGLIDINTLTTGIQQSSSTPQPPLGQIQSPIPPPPIAQPPVQHPRTQPGWESFSYQTIEKLSRLDPNEASMIAQVLRLTPDDLTRIPQDQLGVVQNIRSQYV